MNLLEQLQFVVLAVVSQLALATSINGQDNVATELLAHLKTGSAKEIEQAIESIPSEALDREDVVGQLTLLLNDERRIIDSFNEPARSAVNAIGKLGDRAKPVIHALELLEQNSEISDSLREDVHRVLLKLH